MSGVVPRRSKSGELYCAVVGCHNSTLNTKGREPPVKFYRFPGRWYEKERRQAWIKAVRRVNPDGSPWTPSDGARVCSTHFVDNRKVDMSEHPAYIPTIFPPIYKTKASDRERAERHQSSLTEAASSTQKQNLPQTTTEAVPIAVKLEASVSADRTEEEHEHQMDCSDNFQDCGMPTSDTDDLKPYIADDISPMTQADVACQTESSTTGKLTILLSMTDSAAASTQVTHTEQVDQVTGMDGS